MDILAFLIFGALAGWVASIVMGTNSSQGAIGNIIVGTIGAWVGGFLFNIFGADGADDFSWYSFLVAVVGAVVLLWVMKLVRK